MHWMLYGLLVLFMWVVHVLLWLYLPVTIPMTVSVGARVRPFFLIFRLLPVVKHDVHILAGRCHHVRLRPMPKVAFSSCSCEYREGVCVERVCTMVVVLCLLDGPAMCGLRVCIYLSKHIPMWKIRRTATRVELAFKLMHCWLSVHMPVRAGNNWQHTQNHRYIGVFVVIIFMCCNPQCQIDDPGSRPDVG